jgi:mannose-6-phosphate isomerase-like protein (cupin superfamily)
MKDHISQYIASGILELYALGMATVEESKEVAKMAAEHKEIQEELDKINSVLEAHARQQSKVPPITAKALLLATIDYSERLKNGEPVAFPPVLDEKSKISDYAEWLNRKDMVAPEDIENIFAKIIGYTPQHTTAILWIRDYSPAEVHDHEHEKFLILEGECDIVVDGNVLHFKPGDYFAIPLHSTHSVKVTSKIPCKAILQRSAA